MSNDPILIRPADTGDVALLSGIARAAKASWGYSAEAMAAMSDALTVTEKILASEIVHVAAAGEAIAGWVSYVPVRENVLSVEGLWVDPAWMGKAVGRALWDFMERDARDNGFSTVEVLSDPNAFGFYEKMGCRYDRDEPSNVFGADRLLPLLVKQL